jgi:KipI family sensor histidine kinase inhibitor
MSERIVQTPKILPCGDSALTVEFGDSIDPDLNGKVLALDELLRERALPGLLETVPTYRSLLVQFDPVATDYEALANLLAQEAAKIAPRSTTGRRWQIPVVYGGPFGVDLEEVAERHGLTPAQLIDLHAQAVYRVYMIGFLPGFAYLGGLDARLATPRRTQPRAKIPSGSIIIGGSQAAVGSIESPSGWHLLGRTPVRSYAPERDPAFLLAAGDEVVFCPIDASRWESLERAALAGEVVAETVEP